MTETEKAISFHNSRLEFLKERGMKIACLIPHRNDRPRFLSHLHFMLQQQTIQPDIIHFVDYEPESDKKDITQRYRRGYDQLRGSGVDVIFLLEVDDHYSPTYIADQLDAWISAGKPDIFGMRQTEYYHIKHFAHFTFHHEQRSSAMNTLIRPDLTFNWCADDYEYTDVHLFQTLSYKLWLPPKPICIGIKHGSGLCGGQCHDDDLSMYRNRDPKKDWLRAHTDPTSFDFYSTFFEADTVTQNATM